VAIHVGKEGGEHRIVEIREVVSLRPDQTRHGILTARDAKLMAQICGAGIVPEICPTSNLLTNALESEEALCDASGRKRASGVARKWHVRVA
jgi:adenosine deaminase